MAKMGMTPKKAAELRAEKGLTATNLQKIRIKKGLSQTELSLLSGVPLNTLASFEQRKRQIEGAKLSALCDLCMVLDCSIADIIDDKEIAEKYNKIK